MVGFVEPWLRALRAGVEIPSDTLDDVAASERAVEIIELLDELPVSEAIYLLDQARRLVLAGTRFRADSVKAEILIAYGKSFDRQE